MVVAYSLKSYHVINNLFNSVRLLEIACHLIEPRDAKAFLPQRRLYKESLQCIKKLHCIMEVLCLSRERLSLAMTEQEIQTRKLLEYFAKNPLNWDKTFHFDIPMNTISPILTGYLNKHYRGLYLMEYLTICPYSYCSCVFV